MDPKDLARQVVLDSFPEECTAAGPSSVDDILGGVEIVPPDEGRPFPIHEILQFLKDVLEFTLVLIPIVKILWDQYKKKPTVDQVKAEAEKQGVKRGKLTSEQAEKAIKGLLKSVKDIRDLTG
jgi:hypothetical protein